VIAGPWLPWEGALSDSGCSLVAYSLHYNVRRAYLGGLLGK
jgi:hypothetical protein